VTLHFLQITAKRDLGGGNTAVNTYAFHPDSGSVWSGTNRTTVANLLIGHLKTFYTALGAGGMSGAYDIGTVVLEYDGTNPPVYVPTTPQTSTVTASTTIANQLAAVCTWRTAIAGRRFRGRSYIGPLTIGVVSSAAISSTFVNAANTAVTTLLSNIAGTTFDLCVASHANDSSESVTSGVFTSAVRTMRSRAS
jgi:hypothetical protein